MPKNLAKTDVVIVGMGAAGGVAALPLTNAGLKVVGIEAGGWLNLETLRLMNLEMEPETGRSPFRKRRAKRRPCEQIQLKKQFRVDTQ